MPGCPGSGFPARVSSGGEHQVGIVSHRPQTRTYGVALLPPIGAKWGNSYWMFGVLGARWRWVILAGYRPGLMRWCEAESYRYAVRG